MIKWSLAAIPAVIVISIILGLIGAVIGIIATMIGASIPSLKM
jgi:hypothetical protein